MGRKKRAQKKKIKEEKPAQKRGVDPKFLIAILALIALAIIIFSGSGNSPPTPPEQAIAGKYTLFQDKSSLHEQGKAKMMVFFDFYCSHCYSFDTGVLPQLQGKYGRNLEVIPVGYPIFGAKAVPALQAYELAKDQSKGEEMKQAIFRAYHTENRDISDNSVLASIASEVGFDAAGFKAALDSDAKMDKVRTNIALGESYNLKQTPTAVLDGRIAVTSVSMENLDTIISDIIS